MSKPLSSYPKDRTSATRAGTRFPKRASEHFVELGSWVEPPSPRHARFSMLSPRSSACSTHWPRIPLRSRRLHQLWRLVSVVMRFLKSFGAPQLNGSSLNTWIWIRGPGGLEIGVAGLTYVLSMVGFLTAASCRAHAGERSWSDCPVVLFGAHRWRAVVGRICRHGAMWIGSDRGMLTVYVPSVADLMVLARQLFDRRSVFRRRPTDDLRPRLDGNPEQSPQQTLDLGL